MEDVKRGFAVEVVNDHTHRMYVYLHDKERYPYHAAVGATTVERWASDLIFFASDKREEEVAAVLKNAFFRRYVQRLFVVSTAPISSEEELADKLVEAASALSPRTFRYIGYPKKKERSMCDLLSVRGMELSPTSFTSVLYGGVIEKKGVAFFGVSQREPFQREMVRGEDFVSKAQYKMEELLSSLNLLQQIQPKSILDLGASPGGWSMQVAQAFPDSRVLAVDKGSLHPSVLALPNITHSATTLTPANAESVLSPHSPFDVVVCDINVHPAEACTLLRPVLSYLRSGGVLVFTVKCLAKKMKAAESGLIDVVKRFLSPSSASAGASADASADADARVAEQKIEGGEKGNGTFSNIDVMWLIANTTNERTIIAVKD
uniref:Ribosomal RNA methyltransferase FtsJ domain-containing protein n=1 Tax=Palpitomonas bilix TaxID=652834 RepID=A0A7S3CXG9_9EUKA